MIKKVYPYNIRASLLEVDAQEVNTGTRFLKNQTKIKNKSTIREG